MTPNGGAETFLSAPQGPFRSTTGLPITAEPMPVDRANRDRAAAAIAAYLRGEIDNFKLDDETLGLRTRDRAVIDTSLGVWLLYHDIKRHTVRCSPEAWAFLVRCVAFLRTDAEAHAKLTDATLDYAPFPSADAWEAHRASAEPKELPPYDPIRHAPPRRGAFDRFLCGRFSWLRVGVLVIVIAVAFIAVTCVLLRSRR